MASDSAPEILMLLPDEPGQYSTGGAVRAWHFLAQICGLGRLTGFVLSRGVSGETILAKGKRCRIVRMPSDAAVPVTPSWRRYVQILLTPWQNHGRQLLLAGHNICAQRSAAAGFRFGHWCYGLYLLLLFSLLRRLTSLDPTDCHVRGDLIDCQLGQIRDHYRQRQPDLIWIEHSYLYSVAEQLQQHFPGTRIAVNAHNVETELKAGGARRHGTWLGRLWLQQEAALSADIERRMVRNAWLILSCSQADAARFELMVPTGCSAKANILVAANGVDTTYFAGADCSNVGSAGNVVFTGTAGYGPNDDAVEWLLQEIWPDIRQRCPQACLTLAGRSAGSRWLPMTRGIPGVRVISDPIDMRPVLQGATLAIVPLRSGSGTRLKIVESMSMGVPVVSTAIGAEGLMLTAGQEVLLEDTATGLAAAAVRLLQDESLRRQLSQAGRARAVRDYDWSRITSTFGRSLAELDSCFSVSEALSG